MPVKDITDYSNTIIYKIICRDSSINEIYVGHTIDFASRKKSHKNNCTKSNYEGYNSKVYKIIRENGGWNNWTMNIVAFFNCKNLEEAKEKEQEYFILLGGTLNSIEPMPKKKIKEKITLHKIIKEQSNYNNFRYVCELCNFNCIKKSNYNIHLTTTKHNNNTNKINVETNKSKTSIFCKKCNKEYRARNSLWYHERKCSINLNNKNNSDDINYNVIDV